MHRDVPEFKRCWTDSGTIVMKKKHIQQLSMLRSYKDLRNWPWIGKSHDTCHLLLPVLETCWNKCFLHQRFPVTSLRFHWTYTLHIPISDCPSYFGNCCARKFIICGLKDLSATLLLEPSLKDFISRFTLACSKLGLGQVSHICF